jgi:hypothetical protein
MLFMSRPINFCSLRADHATRISVATTAIAIKSDLAPALRDSALKDLSAGNPPACAPAENRTMTPAASLQLSWPPKQGKSADSQHVLGAAGSFRPTAGLRLSGLEAESAHDILDPPGDSAD